jgi:aldose 1-epimerase
MKVKVSDYGGTIVSILAPDRNGKFGDIALGFKTLAEYQEKSPYFGCITGRYANRIADGNFTLEGKKYSLAANNGKNHLHGGVKGFDKRLWAAEVDEDDIAVTFTRTSPDGEEGYPGALVCKVTYTLTNDNELRIDYKATTDKPTVLNLTNHCYWNLAGTNTENGTANGTILEHQLTLDCDHYLPVSDTLIPLGQPAVVADTPMDFTVTHPIGSKIDQVPGGYDHCYVINNADGSLKPVAEIYDPSSGRVMEILTTEPGIQFYTGNFLDGKPNNGGFSKHAAFCLECQHFPDSPNQPDFPTTQLEPGDTYTQTTVHRFSVRTDQPERN